MGVDPEPEGDEDSLSTDDEDYDDIELTDEEDILGRRDHDGEDDSNHFSEYEDGIVYDEGMEGDDVLTLDEEIIELSDDEYEAQSRSSSYYSDEQDEVDESTYHSSSTDHQDLVHQEEALQKSSFLSSSQRFEYEVETVVSTQSDATGFQGQPQPSPWIGTAGTTPTSAPTMLGAHVEEEYFEEEYDYQDGVMPLRGLDDEQGEQHDIDPPAPRLSQVEYVLDGQPLGEGFDADESDEGVINPLDRHEEMPSQEDGTYISRSLETRRWEDENDEAALQPSSPPISTKSIDSPSSPSDPHINSIQRQDTSFYGASSSNINFPAVSLSPTVGQDKGSSIFDPESDEQLRDEYSDSSDTSQSVIATVTTSQHTDRDGKEFSFHQPLSRELEKESASVGDKYQWDASTDHDRSAQEPSERRNGSIGVDIQDYPSTPKRSERLSMALPSPLRSPKPKALPIPRQAEDSIMHMLIDANDWKTLLEHMATLRNESSEHITYELTKTDPSQGATVLLRVVANAPIFLTKLLLSIVPFGSRRDILLLADNDGNTALHVACKGLQAQQKTHTMDGAVIKTLAIGAPEAHELQNNDGDIPLSLLLTSDAMKATSDPDLVAIESPAQDLVRTILVDRPSLTSIPNKQDQTLLHVAAANNVHQRVLLLLLANAEFAADVSDAHGKLPLHYVASTFTSALPPLDFAEQLILIAPEALTTPCSGGNTPLHLLVKNIEVSVQNQDERSSFGTEQLTEALLGRSPVESMCPLLVKNKDGMTPLHYCAQYSTPASLVKILMRSQLSRKAANLLNLEKKTPLHIACESSLIPSMVDLIKLVGTEESSTKKDAKGRTPILLAAENPECTAAAMQALLDVNPKMAKVENLKGRLPLHVVLKKNAKKDIVRALLTAYPKATKSIFDGGNGIFHEMCQFKTPSSIIKELLEIYPDGAKQANKVGNLPLHVATAYQCDLETIQALVDAYPEACIAQNKQKDTPAHYAASYRASTKSLGYLVSAYPRVATIPNEKGATPMDLCKKNGTDEVLTKILRKGELMGKSSPKSKKKKDQNHSMSPTKVRQKLKVKSKSTEEGRSKSVGPSSDKRGRSKSRSRDDDKKPKSSNSLDKKKERTRSKSRVKSADIDKLSLHEKKKLMKKLTKSLGSLNYDHDSKSGGVSRRSTRSRSKARRPKAAMSSSSDELGYKEKRTAADTKKIKKDKHRKSRSMSPSGQRGDTKELELRRGKKSNYQVSSPRSGHKATSKSRLESPKSAKRRGDDKNNERGEAPKTPTSMSKKKSKKIGQLKTPPFTSSPTKKAKVKSKKWADNLNTLRQQKKEETEGGELGASISSLPLEITSRHSSPLSSPKKKKDLHGSPAGKSKKSPRKDSGGKAKVESKSYGHESIAVQDLLLSPLHQSARLSLNDTANLIRPEDLLSSSHHQKARSSSTGAGRRRRPKKGADPSKP